MKKKRTPIAIPIGDKGLILTTKEHLKSRIQAIYTLNNNHFTVKVVESVKGIKAIKFYYQITPEISTLLQRFRTMINEAIHICLTENTKGRFALRNRIYKDFRDRYGVMSAYPYSVAEIAWSIVKKHKKWHRKPYAEHLMLKLDWGGYNLHGSILNLQYKKGQRLKIPLQYGDYQRSFLMDKTLKRGSLTMTDSTIIIAFSKEMVVREPLGKVGYDINECSLVGATSNGESIFHDLSNVAYNKAQYRMIRAGISHKTQDDNRVKTKLLAKYGTREADRVKQELHVIAKKVVQHAKANNFGIVMENLKGIRNASRKGNGQGKHLRGRLNTWPFRQLQSYIDYKAKWEGIMVEYVRASKTSQTCSYCGFVNKELKAERVWLCPCGVRLDRDFNAARNILARASPIPVRPLVVQEVRGS